MSQSRATFFALLAVLCWSTVATAFKLSLVHLSPLQLIFVASVSALVFFLVLLAWQRRLAELLQQDVPTYWRSFGFALLNPVLYYIVLFYAYSQLPAQEAQSLNYSWAIVLTLMAVPFLGHNPQFLNSSIPQFLSSSVPQFFSSSIRQFLSSSVHQIFNS